MKIKILILLLTIGFLVPSFSLAENILGDDLTRDVAGKGGYSQSVNEDTMSKTVGQIVRIILGMVGTLFLGLTVYAGILWMTAAGEDDKVTKSKNIIRTSLIGLVIVVAAYSVSYYVVNWIMGAQEQPELVGTPDANTIQTR